MQRDKCPPCLICKLDGRWGVFLFLHALARGSELCGRDQCMTNLLSSGSYPRTGWTIIYVGYSYSWNKRFRFQPQVVLLLNFGTIPIFRITLIDNITRFPKVHEACMGQFGVALPSAVHAAAFSCVAALCFYVQRQTSVSLLWHSTLPWAYVWLAYNFT